MNHHCHARGCKTPCKPEMLMCRRHWLMVSRVTQARVWNTYRPGQCDDKAPSPEWHEAADAAIAEVWARENQRRCCDRDTDADGHCDLHPPVKRKAPGMMPRASVTPGAAEPD